MSKIESPGKYKAKVTDANLGQSDGGKPYLYLNCSTESGSIGAWLYLSDAALPATVKSLRESFNFDGNFETVVSQVVYKECSIVVEEEENQDTGETRLRVRWVNPVMKVTPISDESSFLKALSAKAARIPKAAPKAGAAPAKAPAPKPAARPAAKVTEDAPF